MAPKKIIQQHYDYTDFFMPYTICHSLAVVVMCMFDRWPNNFDNRASHTDYTTLHTFYLYNEDSGKVTCDNNYGSSFIFGSGSQKKVLFVLY